MARWQYQERTEPIQPVPFVSDWGGRVTVLPVMRRAVTAACLAVAVFWTPTFAEVPQTIDRWEPKYPAMVIQPAKPHPSRQSQVYTPIPVFTEEVLYPNTYFPESSQPLNQRVRYHAALRPTTVEPLAPIGDTAWGSISPDPPRRAPFVPGLYQNYSSFVSVVLEVIPLSWGSTSPDPPRRVAFSPGLYQNRSQVPVYGPAIITIDRWTGFYPDRVVRRTPHAPIGWYAFVPLNDPREVIGLDKWYRQATDPVRVRPRLTLSPSAVLFDIGALAVPETITLDKWYQPVTDPVRPRRPIVLGALGTAFIDLSFLEPPEAVTVDKWFRQTTDPVRVRPRPVLGAPSVVLFDIGSLTPPETISLDKWYQPIVDPTRRRDRPAIWLPATDLVLPGALRPEVIEFSKWYQPIVDPTRPPSRVAHLQIVLVNIESAPGELPGLIVVDVVGNPFGWSPGFDAPFFEPGFDA